MSRYGLFHFENEPIWLIHDSSSLLFFNRFGRTVSDIRVTRFGIGGTVPATRDTRVRLVVLVYCQARATPNERLRPNAATTVDYRVGLTRVLFLIKKILCLSISMCVGRPHCIATQEPVETV
jgi:hypothetical protein